MSQVEKEIYFYKVDAGKDVSGKLLPFDPAPVLNHIDKLSFPRDVSDKSRYWKDTGDNNKVVACWVDSKTSPFKVRLGTIRRSDFPQVEQQGEVTALEMAEGSGLLEQTHIVFFEDGIAGSDYNFYGPRITRFPYYLADKAVGIAPPALNISPIIRTDIYKQLLELKFLKMFTIKLRAPLSDSLRDLDESIWKMFEIGKNLGDADTMELILSASGRKSSLLNERLMEFAKRALKKSDIQRDVKKFHVKGYNQKKQENVVLDLLSDRFVVKKSILKMDRRSRALNSTSAYKAIISAYEELKDEILDSASIEI